MKLGLSLLVFGLLVAAIGLGLWQYGSAGQVAWDIVRSAEGTAAIGLGISVFGGGLAIGGIIRMIIKR
jgi:hypothetical protein